MSNPILDDAEKKWLLFLQGVKPTTGCTWTWLKEIRLFWLFWWSWALGLAWKKASNNQPCPVPNCVWSTLWKKIPAIALAGPQTRRPDQAEEDKRHQENQNRQLSYWPLPATGQRWEIRWNWGSPIEKACEKHFKCRNLLLVCVGCVSREDGNPTALLLRTGCLADLASATSFLPSETEGKTSTHIWRCWMMIWTWPPQKKICSIPKSSEQDQFI